MKVNLTKEEYLTLLDIFEIADWVLHSHRAEQQGETMQYSELEQKIYALAGDFGCGDMVEYSESDGRYYPARAIEEGPARDFMDTFEEDTFWARLVEYLAERDLVREMGKDKFGMLDREERWERLEKIESRYWDEFQANGVERLEIVELPWYDAPDMHSA